MHTINGGTSTEEPIQAHHPLAGSPRVSGALYTYVVVP